MGHFTSCGCSIQYTTVQKASGQLCSEKSHDSRNKMQDHCNGHRCHGDRFSLYEKCSHRQDLHCSGVGLPSSVFHLAGQDHQAHRADSGKCRINPTRDTIRLRASIARRDNSYVLIDSRNSAPAQAAACVPGKRRSRHTGTVCCGSPAARDTARWAPAPAAQAPADTTQTPC